MAKSHDTSLQEILEDIGKCITQLPDFQRGWVWNDDQICGLIASISNSYPVGAVMFLESGGRDIRFKARTFTNVENTSQTPQMLVLDGQQRLTSAFCALYSRKPVPTQTTKKEDIKRYYYLDIKKCMEPGVDRKEAVVSVPEDRQIKEYFGRRVITDLSTREKEFENHMFPLNIVFDSVTLDEWKDEYRDYHNDPTINKRLRLFTANVLNPIIRYTLPVIQLDKATPKEAVCQVFENVNQGGVALTVFELVTAIFASDDFLLREDWEKQAKTMKEAEGTFDLLSVVAATDYLASMTLLAQYKQGKTLTVKRKDVLSLALNDYKTYKDSLTKGYIQASRFLVQQSILTPRDLPYTTQFIPLAVIMTVLGSRAEDSIVKEKLAAWYWCGVFGEMYGAANETRYANDVSGVLAWIEGGEEPDTVRRAFFQPTRLLSLRTRNGAAYKGIFALLLANGARDFISGSRMDYTNFVADFIDIHHIFPKKYCESQRYDERKWNCIVNKTPIAYRTNRKLGGNAPSKYLKAIEDTNVSSSNLNINIESHGIDVGSLREDDFSKFFVLRAKNLLNLIGKAMGKPITNLDGSDVVEAFGASLV